MWRHLHILHGTLVNMTVTYSCISFNILYKKYYIQYQVGSSRYSIFDNMFICIVTFSEWLEVFVFLKDGSWSQVLSQPLIQEIAKQDPIAPATGCVPWPTHGKLHRTGGRPRPCEWLPFFQTHGSSCWPLVRSFLGIVLHFMGDLPERTSQRKIRKSSQPCKEAVSSFEYLDPAGPQGGLCSNLLSLRTVGLGVQYGLHPGHLEHCRAADSDFGELGSGTALKEVVFPCGVSLFFCYRLAPWISHADCNQHIKMADGGHPAVCLSGWHCDGLSDVSDDHILQPLGRMPMGWAASQDRLNKCSAWCHCHHPLMLLR